MSTRSSTSERATTSSGSAKGSRPKSRARPIPEAERIVVAALGDSTTNGWPDTEAPIRQLNKLIADIALAEDVALLPFYDTLEDPNRPGRMRAEWTHRDGDHPSISGYRELGVRVASLFG